MSLPLAGALACWLSVSAMLLAPQLRLPRVRLGRDHPDAAALHDAGWARPLWQWEAARGVIALVSIAIALAAGIPAAPAAAAAAIAPSIAVRVRAAAAQRRSRIATTRLLRVTEATLRASGGIAEALRRAVAGCDDALARAPFEESLRAFDLGAALDEALGAAAVSSRDPRVRLSLETLAIGVSARVSGDRAAVLLGAVADRLAFEERVDEEVRARTSGLRAQVILLAAVVPGIAVYLALTVPSLGATLTTPLGRNVLIPAAAALEIIGIVASRRAVDGVLR